MAEKSCGSCTMCCKLLGIKELGKQPGTWCEFCDKGRGCAIYDSRPTSCREYECLYLMGFDQGVTPPIELRPDKSKVVISPGMGTALDESEIVAVHVDPAYPDRWKQEPTYGILTRLADSGAKIVIGCGSGNQKKLMQGNGTGRVTIETITMSDPDEDGVQWVNK